MRIKFETSGTDKRKIIMLFENDTELDNFVSSLSINAVQNWITNINIDFTMLRTEITFLS